MSKTFQVRFGQVREFLGDGLNLPFKFYLLFILEIRTAQDENDWRTGSEGAVSVEICSLVC